jgi:hypothetical protein
MQIYCKFLLISVFLCFSEIQHTSSPYSNYAGAAMQCLAVSGMCSMARLHGEEMVSIGRLPEGQIKRKLKKDSLDEAQKFMNFAIMSISMTQIAVDRKNDVQMLTAGLLLGYLGLGYVNNLNRITHVKQEIEINYPEPFSFD